MSLKTDYSFFPLLIMVLITLLISVSDGYSQQRFLLTGKVVDLEGKMIDTADLTLINTIDSLPVKLIQITSSKFSFGHVGKGVYLLTISSEGFDNQAIKIDLNVDKDIVVQLKESSKSLNEVKISGYKQIFTNHNGNIKVNVENSILSKVSNPLDLMAKLPAVQISPDRESINIVGRGEPLIYLGQQRISMNDLNSLSTGDISTIEIINNPSAKYEAEGRSVILITRSKNKVDEFKVDLTETASFKRFYHNRSGLNVNYKKNKLELRGNVQYNYLNLWESNSNDFTIPDAGVRSAYRVYSTGLRQQTIAGGGIYYQMNDSDYLSFYASKRFQNEDFTIATNSFIQQPATVGQSAVTETASTVDRVVTTNYNNDNKPYFNANLNYNKRLKKINGQLFLGAQYAKFATGLTSTIYNNYNETETILSQDRNQEFNIDVWSGRADFELAFKNEGKWETGAAISSAVSNSVFDLVTYNPLNPSGSEFDYSENIYAAYTQLSGKMKGISYSAGVRMENTRVRGSGVGNEGLLVNKNYTKFFPKALLDIPLAAGKSLNIAYAKTISRPNYSTASQITTYINPFFEWSSNINIEPTLKDEWSATMQVNDKSLGVNYYRIKNPVYNAISFNEQTNILTMAPKNYELESGVSVTLTVPFTYKIWTSTNVVNGILGQIKDPSATLNKSRPYVYAYSNHQLQLPAGYTFMVNGWGLTKRNEGAFEHNAMYAVDFGLSKTLFKKLNCTVSYNSLFSTRESTENFSVNKVISKGVYYSDVREFAISLRYSFGKIKESNYKNKEVTEDPGRIK